MSIETNPITPNQNLAYLKTDNSATPSIEPPIPISPTASASDVSDLSDRSPSPITLDLILENDDLEHLSVWVISATEKQKRSLLYKAISKEKVNIIQFFLDSNLEIDCIEENGISVLNWAIWKNREDLVIQLLNNKVFSEEVLLNALDYLLYQQVYEPIQVNI